MMLGQPRSLAYSASVDTRPAARIPSRAHFIWLGARFPWVNVLAVRSAALRGGFDEVVLHHDSDLSATPSYRELVETPNVTLCRLDVGALLERCGRYERGLADVFSRLRTPAPRADLLRFALLYTEGGVYLDIDTITVRDFAPLRQFASAFFGLEHIVFPAHVRNSRDPRVLVAAQLRSGLRTVMRVAPHGWRAFSRVERLYHQAANCAIVGAAKGAPLIEELIERMLALPAERQHLLNVIGTHLLQQTYQDHRGQGVEVHAPATFFPLAPEISWHWFRTGSRPEDLARIVRPETRLVHWYASVRTRGLVGEIDPAYVRRHAHHQLFSALALPFVSPR